MESVAYTYYKSLSCEKQKEIGEVLAARIAGVNVWPTSARKIIQDSDFLNERGVISIKLLDYAEEIRGLDFLDFIVIDSLGFKFDKPCGWMVEYANDPSNPSTDTIFIGVKVRPNMAFGGADRIKQDEEIALFFQGCAERLKQRETQRRKHVEQMEIIRKEKEEAYRKELAYWASPEGLNRKRIQAESAQRRLAGRYEPIY